MSKKYTKKQIQEAIAYWNGQLAEGNYKTLDEGLKNKLLGWLGIRSNYEELEDLVDEIASSKKIKLLTQRRIKNFAHRLSNDNAMRDKLKGFPKNFDEDDIMPIVKKALNRKLGSKSAADQRYAKAIRLISLAIAAEMQDDIEYAKKLKAELDAMDKAWQEKEAEKRRKERDAEEAKRFKSYGYGSARRGGEWNYDPAYANPSNNNSPWSVG